MSMKTQEDLDNVQATFCYRIAFWLAKKWHAWRFGWRQGS